MKYRLAASHLIATALAGLKTMSDNDLHEFGRNYSKDPTKPLDDDTFQRLRSTVNDQVDLAAQELLTSLEIALPADPVNPADRDEVSIIEADDGTPAMAFEMGATATEA